jgi:hypothetical protein
LEHVLRQNSDSLIIFAAVKPQKTGIMANSLEDFIKEMEK